MNKSRLLYDFLSECGYDPRSYSGRGMYGKECIAISTDDSPAMVGFMLGNQFAQQQHAESDDVRLDAIQDTHSDSLGKGVILYWPSFEWTAELDALNAEVDKNTEENMRIPE